jgi:hypothetical protein
MEEYSMKRLLRRFAPLATVLVAMAMVAPQSAYAATGDVIGAGVVTGGGNISPGLTTTPTIQTSVTFSGTLVGAATWNPSGNPGDNGCQVNGPVTFSGASTNPETVALGGGSGSVLGSSPCSGTTSSPGSGCKALVSGTVTISGNLSYTRAGAEVLVTGNVTVSASLVVIIGVGCPPNFSATASGTVAGAFHFVPTTANPTTSYLLAGAAAIVAA